MQEILNLINEMSPYLLLGFGIAGLMHTCVPHHLYNRYLSGKGMGSVFYAAVFGIPLPLCSCGVLPTAMSLRREGASKGATTSFLIATPQTGIDSIMATYSLMGLPFAILRPIAALVTALLGGALVNVFDHDNTDNNTDMDTGTQETSQYTTWKSKFLGALKYGYIEMMQDIGKWLVIGLLVVGLITIGVPDDFFIKFAHRPLLGMLLVLACAVPMYLCATGSIPIAVALMLKGMTPGAALVLLMAGPAVNVASILVIRKILGRRTLWLYLSAVIGGALAFALTIDYLLPREWFTSALIAIQSPCHSKIPWFNILCTIILVLLLAYALWRRFFHRKQHECRCEDSTCCCTTSNNVSNRRTTAIQESNRCTASNHESNRRTTAIHNNKCCTTADYDNNQQTNVAVYHIQGMHCNHCRNNVLRTVSNLSEVDSVEVDLQSGTMHVSGTASPLKIIQAVEGLGFTAVQE